MTAATVLARRANPFDDELARGNSSYSGWRMNKLVRLPDTKQMLAARATTAHNDFREFIANTNFPCVGAKAAINNNCYRFGFYNEMNTRAATAGLARDLWQYAQERPSFGSNYATFVASFAQPEIVDEPQWEKLLWAQLQNLHELDAPLHAWDASVSSDPESADFSFSFAGTGFFIVGLHPQSSRLARRFAHPTLVFNAHSQFQRLRADNKFDRMRETIRARDLKLQGSLNPNLSNFGEHSEARQYSGRAVEKKWKCPFKALFGGEPPNESKLA